MRCHHQAGSNCTKCHDTQERFIQGEVLGEKEALPDVMAEGVKCVECHTTISERHSLTEVKKTCVQCHEKRYGEMPDGWQKEVSEQMKRLRLSLEALRAGKKVLPDTAKNEVDVLAKKVEEVLKAIDKDKSKGVHNFIYAKRLMSEVEKRVPTTKKTISKVLE